MFSREDITSQLMGSRHKIVHISQAQYEKEIQDNPQDPTFTKRQKDLEQYNADLRRTESRVVEERELEEQLRGALVFWKKADAKRTIGVDQLNDEEREVLLAPSLKHVQDEVDGQEKTRIEWLNRKLKAQKLVTEVS